MSIHDDLDNLAILENRIYEHVNYVHKWKAYPLDDQRAKFWSTDKHGIKFCPTREKLLLWLTEEDDSGECYSYEIEGNSLRRGIYRGAEITAIEVDTRTDGNKFLMLLRNENEVKFP